MDTSPHDIFILDQKPGQEKLGRHRENVDDGDVEEVDSSEENSEDNDSVSAMKGVGTNERGMNGVKNRGHVSSDESSDDDDDDDVDISTVAPAKAAVATSCILTNTS